MAYKHTQIGRLLIFISIILAAYFVGIFIAADLDSSQAIIMLLIMFVLVSFVSLTISIDEDYLRIQFGYGIYRKQFKLGEIVNVRTVRNHWYYGWGIRLWYWPRMVIFNVSGFDAVEIEMKDGKIYRLGTDEAGGLYNAITQAIR